MHTPDAAARAAPPASLAQVTWLGHATVVSQWGAGRCWPTYAQREALAHAVGLTSASGRLRSRSIMPKVDAIVISHNHYDHLDLARGRTCYQQPSAFFVPLAEGLLREARRGGSENVVEMDWGRRCCATRTSAQAPAGTGRWPSSGQCI